MKIVVLQGRVNLKDWGLIDRSRSIYKGGECAAAVCEACEMRRPDVLQTPCPDRVSIGTREKNVTSSFLFLPSP